MKNFSSLLEFRVDQSLPTKLKKNVDEVLSELDGVQIKSLSDVPNNKERLVIDFISENNLGGLTSSETFKICLLDPNQGLFSFGNDLDQAPLDAILEENFDLKQLAHLIEPHLFKMLKSKQDQLLLIGTKNLKKIESKMRQFFLDSIDGALTPEFLLNYAQLLVDLKKQLIQSDDLPKIEKILKQFTKSHFLKLRFNLLSEKDFCRVDLIDYYLPLPYYKGKFSGIEFDWNSQTKLEFTKFYFFYVTLVNFFRTQTEIDDPFFDESLWNEVLDSIPFPVALLSSTGELLQHNTLFSKLNFPPISCLNLRPKDKIHIHDIPYNIFRSPIFHMDQEKILFVFFTESFFLKGEGNLTPSGQELGIISSSIAHELNNPIAGIQAAVALLLLDENLDIEGRQTLLEMKSGSIRCKQLIETFLGFSRANPMSEVSSSTYGPIDVCYQQAQNLLRFRTVESGIRFNFDSIKHADFRREVNPSLLTMTFYLIFGELMTLYSHQLLVSNKNQIEKVIRGEIVESSSEIQIQLHELNISGLTLSKLIQNLLNIEHFVLQVSDYSLRFIYTST